MLFEKHIETVRKQLGALEPSQRVAIGLCAVLVAGSILWLTQWSMQREMVPLYSEALSEQERADIARQLTLRGEDFEERDETIWVRPDSRRRLMMSLVQHNTGPKSLSYTFKEMVGNENVFAPESSRQRQYIIALQNELAMTIRTMEIVRDATVHIASDREPMRLGHPQGKPKATVTVDMVERERLPKGVVESLARLVSGAVPRLDPRDVTVVDVVGRSYRVGDPEDEFGTELYDLQRHKERLLRQKIEDMLAHIPGVITTVSLKLEDQASHVVERKLGEPAVKREFREEQTQSNQYQGQEPGVEANVGVALTGSASGNSSLREKNETEYHDDRDNTVTTTSKHPGEILEAAASVQVPRSYIVAALKAKARDPEAQPDEAEIDAEAAELTRRIKGMVEPILVARAAPTVEVGVYFDEAANYVAPAQATAEVAEGGVMDFLESHGKQVGLVGLAVVAMIMVLQLVRRGAESVAVPRVDEGDGIDTAIPVGDLDVEGSAIGEAASPDAFLIAHETDEGSIRARQMAKQVTDMINDDPENAAQLVRRWIEREI